MMLAPLLFLGHGSPMNIILDNGFTQSLGHLGKRLPNPRAVLVISAHWETQGTYITAAARPELIYDFYGFPRELYQTVYPCPGGTAVLAKARQHLADAGIQLDADRGIDHGVWSLLRHMYPKADVPVLALSLDTGKSPAAHYAFARCLQPLREMGVMIIGSGNIVHNLRAVDWQLEASPYDWALHFDSLVKKYLEEGNHKRLIDYEGMGYDALLSVPTPEHYLPLLYVLALQGAEEKPVFTFEGLQNASISMRCLQMQ